MTEMELVKEALEARKNSYSPYSGFAVGAALLAKNGDVYRGCNIENGAYGPTICAERTAIFKAVSEGVKDFEAIAIVGGPKDSEPDKFCPPCGVCRQVMSEFCKLDMPVYLYDGTEVKTYTLGELLPLAFEL